MTKKNQKNSRKTKKKQTWASDQTFSEKFCFFGFLVFSRFRKNHSVEREEFYKGKSFSDSTQLFENKK